MRFAVAALLIALDLWSKHAVFAWFNGDPEGLVRDAHGHSRLPVLGNWLALMTSLNPGAAFGKGGDIQQYLVIGRVAAVLLLAWLLYRAERQRPVLLTALVLVLAGALGNLYDNLLMDRPDDAHPFGLVRDFIDVFFTRWDYHFPTFNVADACISVGAVLLLLSGFGGDSPASEAAPAGEALVSEPADDPADGPADERADERAEAVAAQEGEVSGDPALPEPESDETFPVPPSRG